jgi:hypothetical protein
MDRYIAGHDVSHCCEQFETNIQKTFFFLPTFKAKWTENELQVVVAAYRNGEYGLNGCSRVYGVPKATIRRHTMKKIWHVNGVKVLGL